jgi:predicted  nucleic acid-binding Zn-ribbon protein
MAVEVTARAYQQHIGQLQHKLDVIIKQLQQTQAANAELNKQVHDLTASRDNFSEQARVYFEELHDVQDQLVQQQLLQRSNELLQVENQQLQRALAGSQQRHVMIKEAVNGLQSMCM